MKGFDEWKLLEEKDLGFLDERVTFWKLLEEKRVLDENFLLKDYSILMGTNL
jgi:hypothetical protein